jgi:beta-galactosidase
MDRRNLLKAAAVGVAGLAEPYTSWASSPATAPEGDGAPGSPRQVLSLNKGWRFFDGDIPFPVPQDMDQTYNNAKAGLTGGAAGVAFDDSEWAQVALPHDFVISQPFDRTANVAQGYRRRGIVWYRTTLEFDPADLGKHIELQLDGLATLATVWFNGTPVCHDFSGYSSAYIDLTPYATFGAAVNTLAIRVDAKAMEGWWYEGGGLYRNVWIVKRAPTHIVTDGVFAHPVKVHPTTEQGGWTIPVEATLNTIAATDQDVTVTCELLGEGGAPLARAATSARVPSLQTAVATLSLPYAEPRLWSVEDPYLYQVRTTVSQGDLVLDEAITTCGFRTQRFDADKGFFLNDKPVKIKGVCLHPDHAGVGLAVPPSLIAFRLRRLKAMGCNAIRCSHNAQDKAFMDACDRQGFLVMDENRNFNPSPDYLAQLTWLVRRDRNHPSVIMWSVFNEEPMQATRAGYEMVRRLREAVRELDVSRPVTAAMSGGCFTPINVSQALDVMGLNYHQKDYDAFHRQRPDLPMLSSEDTSALSTRGVYRSDPAKHVYADYDDDAESWGATQRQSWKMIAERDFVAGGFVWTGFDYHGEPQPFEWPSNSSLFGVLDLCGFEKTGFWIRQAQWVKDRPVLALVPHWTWPGREGTPIRVMACSNLEAVELLLNGRSLGRQTVDPYDMNAWQVSYTPGRLDLIGYAGGQAVARASVETAGAPVRLRVTPDRLTMRGDGSDVQPFRIEALDAGDRPVPVADHLVTFEVVGEGDIIGLGNGDPTSLEPEVGDRRSLFNGLAQVIVRAREGANGPLKLIARAPGLAPAEISVRVQTAPPLWRYQRTRLPVQSLGDWLLAPPTAAPPDVSQPPSASDLNAWRGFAPGDQLAPPTVSGFTLSLCRFTPYARVRAIGGVIEFSNILGACNVFIDGALSATKASAEAAPLRVPVKAGPGSRRVEVVFKTQRGEPFGFGDVVQVREAD